MHFKIIDRMKFFNLMYIFYIFNGLTEIFIHGKIHPAEVYSSVVFSIFTDLQTTFTVYF